MNPNMKMLIGAAVAAALAIAVYYGAISQQQATGIQNQANQALGTGPVAQQPGQQGSPNSPTMTAPNNAASPGAPAAPR